VAKYEFEFTGVGSLMFGRPVSEPKRDDETHEQHDQRTWKLKINHRDKQACIEPFALTNALVSAGSRLSIKVPGGGKATFTKLFRQGCMCVDPMMLFKPDGSPLQVDDINPQRLFVPSDGKRGSAKRVFRTFPTCDAWKAVGSIMVFDNKITEDILKRHMVEAGKFIGFGSMRVENGGICGRFAVDSLTEVEE